MRFLASLAMRGRSQAAMVATVLAILALPLPPLSILSAAVIALVALRQGLREGMLLITFSGVACALLAQLLFGQALPVVGYVLLMWLPVWVLGGVLRINRSLGTTLSVALLLGVLALAVQYLQSQDPVNAWRELLQPFIASLVEAQLVDQAISQQLVESMAEWMPGAIAAGFVMQAMFALIIARWWQSGLYNPGGFKEEFHQLRLPRFLAVISLLMLTLNWLQPETGLVTYLTLLLLTGWLFQGVALVHALQTRPGFSIGWLVAMYALLPFAMPYLVSALAIVGFADTWFDFRARLGSGRHSGRVG
ncbi:MAG: DUF2232 domain-containing protein [Gammaproteobacteria bacterium]|nr:DUF2232 domain-containing protein [Gammaproteobacteria bacterium]MCB1852310.1 DUF2232 domain-containing protein [Gammaproteobacteria bacterium]MCP5418220.1 DUF2232 domain-containing protein [Chromatiaceae bacterium]